MAKLDLDAVLYKSILLSHVSKAKHSRPCGVPEDSNCSGHIKRLQVDQNSPTQQENSLEPATQPRPSALDWGRKHAVIPLSLCCLEGILALPARATPFPPPKVDGGFLRKGRREVRSMMGQEEKKTEERRGLSHEQAEEEKAAVVCGGH